MTKFDFTTDEELLEKDVLKYREIFRALISCGGLRGIRGGQTIIHFDGEGNFMGIQFSYWPWRRRKGGANVYDGSL